MYTKCLVSLVVAFLTLPLAACGGSGPPAPAPGSPTQGSDLSSFETERIVVGGIPYEVWLAVTPAQQQRGLMFASADQLLPLPDGTPRGMLFPFPTERIVGFVMTNTFVALDLAFIRSDGEIVEIRQLQPLEETPVVPGQLIRYALEVPQGDLAARGVAVGDFLTLPVGSP